MIRPLLGHNHCVGSFNGVDDGTGFCTLVSAVTWGDDVLAVTGAVATGVEVLVPDCPPVVWVGGGAVVGISAARVVARGVVPAARVVICVSERLARGGAVSRNVLPEKMV